VGEVKKKIIRVGMKVRSIYQPEHEFRLDKAIKPDRIFREKGSRRWWTAKELQPVSRKPVKLSARTQKQAAKSRSEAFIKPPFGVTSKSKPTYKRTCLNCGTEFESERAEAKFCKSRGAACRSEYWKRRNQVPDVPKSQLRSEPEKPG
jgi:hypothetical protein